MGLEHLDAVMGVGRESLEREGARLSSIFSARLRKHLEPAGKRPVSGYAT